MLINDKLSYISNDVVNEMVINNIGNWDRKNKFLLGIFHFIQSTMLLQILQIFHTLLK